MKEEIQIRLKKVKGQIEGVEKMLAENRDCEEVLQQLQAVRSAIKKIMILLIEADVCQILSTRKKEELMNKLKLIFKIK